jgi:hypothetical protein
VTTPLRQRLRRDVLVWGLVAGAAAALALGLTGGGWIKAVILGLLVFGGCLLLTLLGATASAQHPSGPAGRGPVEPPGRPSGRPPEDPPPPSDP